jgi:hypothetical protein
VRAVVHDARRPAPVVGNGRQVRASRRAQPGQAVEAAIGQPQGLLKPRNPRRLKAWCIDAREHSATRRLKLHDLPRCEIGDPKLVVGDSKARWLGYWRSDLTDGLASECQSHRRAKRNQGRDDSSSGDARHTTSCKQPRSVSWARKLP